jgi:hypothetical protein
VTAEEALEVVVRAAEDWTAEHDGYEVIVRLMDDGRGVRVNVLRDRGSLEAMVVVPPEAAVPEALSGVLDGMAKVVSEGVESAMR